MQAEPECIIDKEQDPKTPSRRRAIIALLAMLSIYFFSYFQRSAIPGTIFDEIQSDMALTAFAVAALGSMFTYMYGTMQLVVGVSADRVGGQRALLFGGVMMTAGALLFPLSHTLGMLYATRLLTGLGASFMYLCIVKEIDILFDKKRFAAILGLVTSVGYLGGIAGTLPFEKVVSVFGWRQSLTAIGCLTALFLLLSAIALRGFPKFKPTSEAFSFAPILDVLRNRRSRPLLICGLINFPIYFVIQTVLGKKFLEDVAGLTSSSAATFVLFMILTSAVTSIIGGASLGLMGHRRKPSAIAASVLIFCGAAVMLGGTLFHAHGNVFLLAYVMFAIAMGASPACVALMKELNRADSAGVSISIFNGTTYIGAGIIGNLAGFVLDRFRGTAILTGTGTVYPPEAYAYLFAILTVLGVISVITILFVGETRGTAVYEQPLS